MPGAISQHRHHPTLVPRPRVPHGRTPVHPAPIHRDVHERGLSWVHVQGTRLVDARGREVRVRGVNLGGWLVQEAWMAPLKDHPKGEPPVMDQATMWAVIEKRFGRAEMEKIRNDYRSAWLTDADFARIEAAGFTTVRVPFTYGDLQEPGGFARLDWAISQAAKHGLYTILDLHGAPGAQSASQDTGIYGENRFFKDAGDVKKAAQLWQQIARRYANRPEVLGYDLLNEPMGASSARQNFQVENQLYQAVRKVDSRHVIFIEDGYKGGFPSTRKYGWKNVAYSIHLYDFTAKRPRQELASLQNGLREAEQLRRIRHVPVYVGEFSVRDVGTVGTLGTYLEALDKADMPWTMWTYKVDMARARDTMWGLYRNTQSAPLDVYHDSPAELERKIALMGTEHMQAVPGEIPMLQRVLAGKHWAPPRQGDIAGS